MQIRPVIAEDAPTIIELLTALGYPGTDSFIERRIKQQIDHPDALMRVAVVQGKVVAFVSLHFIPQVALAGDFCRISYFCVDPTARSGGIGAAMEAEVVTLARARGCDRIELHSNQRRDAAHRFYYRQGYSESPKYLMKMLD